MLVLPVEQSVDPQAGAEVPTVAGKAGKGKMFKNKLGNGLS